MGGAETLVPKLQNKRLVKLPKIYKEHFENHAESFTPATGGGFDAPRLRRVRLPRQGRGVGLSVYEGLQIHQGKSGFSTLCLLLSKQPQQQVRVPQPPLRTPKH